MPPKRKPDSVPPSTRQLRSATRKAPRVQYTPDSLVKVLARDLKHLGFQYKEGLNIDDKPFDRKPTCGIGGLYFCTFRRVHNWVCKGPNIADVSVPAAVNGKRNPVVDVDNEKSKAHAIILSNICKFEDHPAWDDPVFCSAMVSEQPCYLKYAKHQTQRMCENAVLLAPDTIKQVKFQTKEMVTLVMKHHGWLYQYVWGVFKTPEIDMLAVKSSYSALDWVQHKTQELCDAAFASSPNALMYIPYEFQTLAMCERAVKLSPSLLKHARFQTDAMIMDSVKRGSTYFSYVRIKTPELCQQAFLINPNVLEFIPKEIQTPEMCMTALRTNLYNICYALKQTPELCAYLRQLSPGLEHYCHFDASGTRKHEYTLDA